MTALLRFVLVLLFAMFLASASAATEAHGAPYQADTKVTLASELSPRVCSGTCEHGTAICVQLCLANLAGPVSGDLELVPAVLKSAQVPKADLLLAGLVLSPRLLPPIA